MARQSRAGLQLDGERRHLTVMFTDLVDFTVMGESLGEETVFALTRRIASEQGQAIQTNGGVVQDFAGDGLMAVFGAPVAMEDAALRACRTAIDIQERMYRLQDEFQASYGVKPQLRIGIHTGTAVVGKIGEGKTMSYSALGDTVNVASRLQAAADPGSVCITRATLDVVEGFVDATPLGERQFKGKAQTTEIYRLDAVRSGVTRFGAKRRHGLTQLRGRDVELALLHEHWNVVKAGRFRPVNVIGDAGLGKSRLIFEFTELLREQPVLLLEAICRPEGSAIPFQPLVELMRSWFGIPEEGAPRDLAEAKLSQGLERLKIERESSLPYLLNLVTGSSAPNASLAAMPASELIGVRTREALRKFILSLSSLGPPVVMVVEDLHWIDTASQAVLDEIVRTANDEPLLLLCSFRPQFEPVWALHASAADLRLSALTNVIATEIIRERLEGRALPEELVRLGVTKSEGNPLFAEEFASYLSHKGARAEQSGDASFGGQSDLEDIPTSLENLIMDRVHRLGRETIWLLQAASVLGRQFPMSLAQEVAELNGTAVQLLPQLEQDGLIFRVERERGDVAADYAFKHALVQDALYGSLLTPQRATLHQKAAEALEASYGDKAADVADVLAHHYARTHRSDKAVLYLSLAAKKSLRVFSLAEAQAYLEQALTRIEAEPACADDRLLAEIVVDRLLVCCWEADFVGMLKIADKYRARLEAAGDTRELSRILSWLGEGYLNATRFDEAERVLDRARGIGEALLDEECIAYAMWDQMWLYMVTPEGRPLNAIAKMGERVPASGRAFAGSLSGDPDLSPALLRSAAARPSRRGRRVGREAHRSRQASRLPAGAVAWLGVLGLGCRIRARPRQGAGGQRAGAERLAWEVREAHGRQRPRRGADRRGPRRSGAGDPRAGQARDHQMRLSRAAYGDRDPVRARHGGDGRLCRRRRRSREHAQAVREMAQPAHDGLGPPRPRRDLSAVGHGRPTAAAAHPAQERELLRARAAGGQAPRAQAFRGGGAIRAEGGHGRYAGAGAHRSRRAQQGHGTDDPCARLSGGSQADR